MKQDKERPFLVYTKMSTPVLIRTKMSTPAPPPKFEPDRVGTMGGEVVRIYMWL